MSFACATACFGISSAPAILQRRPRSYNCAMPTLFEALHEYLAARTPEVTITVVDTQGSVPQDPGAKAIVTAAGLRFGTVGGGKVETKAIAEAQRMLRGETK